MLLVKQNVIKFLQLLRGTDRCIVCEHIFRFEEKLPPDGDLEKLYGCRYRMHISRRYNMLLEHNGNETTVLRIMTLEQAHTRY